MSKLRTKVTGAEKKCHGAVPAEVTGGKEDSSNGPRVLDVDLRWNTRCNLSKEITTRKPKGYAGKC